MCMNLVRARAGTGDLVRNTRSRQTAPTMRGGAIPGRLARSRRPEVHDRQMGLAVDVGEDQL